ncbi:MAG: hypothetical protein JO023_18270 [Chloroflexi bacterium]|nr:hypothetical protein [Chloroflexota bacterium]
MRVFELAALALRGWRSHYRGGRAVLPTAQGGAGIRQEIDAIASSLIGVRASRRRQRRLADALPDAAVALDSWSRGATVKG